MVTTPTGPEFVKNTGQSGAKSGDHTHAGLPLDSRTPGPGAGGIASFAYENVVIERVEGIEAARQTEGIIRLDCSLESGQRLGPLRSSDDRQGVIVAVGTDLVDAQRRLAEVQARIRVDVSPVPH